MLVFYTTDKQNVWVVYENGYWIGDLVCLEIGGNVGFIALIWGKEESERIGSFTDTAYRAVESAKDLEHSEYPTDESRKLFYFHWHNGPMQSRTGLLEDKK